MIVRLDHCDDQLAMIMIMTMTDGDPEVIQTQL